MKRSTIIGCTPDALAALAPAATLLAGSEGLDAHGRSISIRLNPRGPA
jgi:histidinol dehydrogenase